MMRRFPFRAPQAQSAVPVSILRCLAAPAFVPPSMKHAASSGRGVGTSKGDGKSTPQAADLRKDASRNPVHPETTPPNVGNGSELRQLRELMEEMNKTLNQKLEQTNQNLENFREETNLTLKGMTFARNGVFKNWRGGWLSCSGARGGSRGGMEGAPFRGGGRGGGRGCGGARGGGRGRGGVRGGGF